MGIYLVFIILLIAAKLANAIDWSWWIVTLPITWPAALLATVLLIILSAYVVRYAMIGFCGILWISFGWVAEKIGSVAYKLGSKLRINRIEDMED